MNFISNYYCSTLQLINNYLNILELSIILLIAVLICFHLILREIIFKRVFDHRLFIKYHEFYKKIRYYSSKIIILTIFLLILVFTTYEFIQYSENFLKYSPFIGLIGAAITFALQEVVLSFAGWLGIFFGKFYFFGDRIKLGNIVGDVIDIGFLRTTLLECGDWVDGDLYNGRIVRIANSFVFKEPVYNYNSKFKLLWDEIKLSLTHESDYEQAKEIIQRTVDNLPVINQSNKFALEEWKKVTNVYFVESAKTEPQVSFSIDRNAIEFTVRYVVNYKQRRITKNEILNKILFELKASGIKASMAKNPLDIWLYVDSEELSCTKVSRQKFSQKS